MPLELEVKLRVPSDEAADKLFDDADIAANVRSKMPPTPFISRYYDTPSGDITSRGWSLRLRVEGDRAIAALKTRAEDTSGGLLFSRNEWQVPAESIYDGIGLLLEEGAPPELREITRDVELVEVCRLDLTRRGVVAELAGGLLVDITEDKGLLVAGGRSEPLHELEVELLFGRGEELEPLVDRFQELYGLERERLSKYERALRLISGKDE